MPKKLRTVFKTEYQGNECPELFEAIKAAERIASKNGIKFDLSVEVVDEEELSNQLKEIRMRYAFPYVFEEDAE